MARAGDRSMHEAAFAVDERDTTGAGDAFRAGFIWGLLQGQAPERALRVANAVAALSCTAVGAQAGLPTRGALEALLETGQRRANAAPGER
jgi:sugar/nucleoside kinase (ribokinase family)